MFKEKFLSSYSYAMKSFDSYNCNEINVSPYCKKFLMIRNLIIKKVIKSLTLEIKIIIIS